MSHCSTQITWTVLPEGFRDSPHLFGQALAHDLQNLSIPSSTLLQYVNDLLCSPSLTISQQDTAVLLNHLSSCGFQVSPSKVQLSLSQVSYLGVLLSPHTKSYYCLPDTIHTKYSHPTMKEEILSFLGLANFLHSWIPNFSLLAAPLYNAAKRTLSEPLLNPINHPIQVLKNAILHTPALHLPDLARPFIVFVSDNHGFTIGAQTQQLGPTLALTAYLSKQLDVTIWGWAPCLHTSHPRGCCSSYTRSKKTDFWSAHHHTIPTPSLRAPYLQKTPNLAPVPNPNPPNSSHRRPFTSL